MANVVSVSSMWIGSLSPSRASLAASRSAGSSSQASPVSVENKAYSAAGTRVLVLEDLQWFDGASDAFLETTVESIPASRAVAPQPVHPQPWLSRGVMAASGFVAAALDRHPLLPGSGTARRDSAVRFALPRRSAGPGR